MTTEKISDRNRLVAWVQDHHTGPASLDHLAPEVADRIRQMDHPAWGDDWSEFLESLDVPKMLCEVEKSK